MQPLLACNHFSYYFIQAGSNDKIAVWFNRAFEALAQDCYGYEFTVRENLSRICLFLYRELVPQTDTQNISLNPDSFRIRKMLAYIHKILPVIFLCQTFQAPLTLAKEKRCAVFRKQSSFLPSSTY